MLVRNGSELVAYPSASGAVTLPDSITSIGNQAFYGCTGLTGVSAPEAASIGQSAFNNCTGLTSVSAPAATSIGQYAFYGCTGLTGVSFPAATSIGNQAFYGCTGLTGVTLGATPPTLGTAIFISISSAKTVRVRIPASATTAYGVPGLPDTNFDNTSTADSWGRAFKGKGWNGTAYQTGSVNSYITLVFETYTVL
jgi:hypothetical protein